MLFLPDLKLPRSYQWNMAIRKSFSDTRAVTLTYVGQVGGDLLRTEGFGNSKSGFPGDILLD